MPEDKDADKNFTWLIESTDLTIPGIYEFQAIAIKGFAQVGTCPITVKVCKLI
jgi:hypothetical protein